MLIYQFTGKLNILYFGAITNMVCIAAGILPVLKNPRGRQWKLTHYRWISWSYVGLIAASVTELIVRTAPLPNQRAVWTATTATTLSITFVGYVLIKHNQPVALN
jgi:hypothetical protein